VFATLEVEGPVRLHWVVEKARLEYVLWSGDSAYLQEESWS